MDETRVFGSGLVVDVADGPVTLASFEAETTGPTSAVTLGSGSFLLDSFRARMLGTGSTAARGAVAAVGSEVRVVGSEFFVGNQGSGLFIDNSDVEIHDSSFEATQSNGRPLYQLSGNTVISDSRAEGTVFALFVDQGEINIHNSVLDSNNGIAFGSLSSGTATVTVDNSWVNRAFFNGTNTGGSQTLTVQNSYFGSGANGGDSFTSVLFRHVTVTASATVTAGTEACTATVEGDTFLQNTCP